MLGVAEGQAGEVLQTFPSGGACSREPLADGVAVGCALNVLSSTSVWTASALLCGERIAVIARSTWQSMNAAKTMKPPEATKTKSISMGKFGS